MSPQDARAAFAAVPGVVVQDDPKNHVYPLATQASGKDEIYVGQLMTEAGNPRAAWIWLVADNLIRGSALNAFELARKILTGKAV